MVEGIGMNGRKHLNLEQQNAVEVFKQRAEIEARKICKTMEGTEGNWELYLTKTSVGPFIKNPEPMV